MTDAATTLLARYLTVGGATVEITATDYSEQDPNRRAVCNGCGVQEETTYWFSSVRHERYVKDATREIRRWSQEHAEYCRAMPAEIAEETE